MISPCNDSFASDDEESDDDVGLSGNIHLPVDVSGIVEIHTDGSALTTLIWIMTMVLMNHIGRQIRKNRKIEPKIFDINSTWYKNGKTENVVEGLPSVSWSKWVGTMHVTLRWWGRSAFY